MSRPVERVCGVRRIRNAPPTIPAASPYEPQETRVIGRSRKVLFVMSHPLGDNEPTIGRTALRIVNRKAEMKVARNAASRPTFKTRRNSFAVWSIVVRLFYDQHTQRYASRMLNSNFRVEDIMGRMEQLGGTGVSQYRTRHYV
jgi:hypothetical protein